MKYNTDFQHIKLIDLSHGILILLY